MPSRTIVLNKGRWGLGLIPCFIYAANDEDAVFAHESWEQS